MTNKIDISNLTGKCLISTPEMSDDFAKAVVYICSHNSDGAMGFIINHRIKEFSFADIARELPFNTKKILPAIDLYNGGPMEKNKGFIIHSDDYIKSNTLSVSKGVAISSSFDILQDIISGTGPNELIVALGYAGWRPNQLEEEILNNRWLIADISPKLIFSQTDDDKWSLALSSIGINLNNFSNKYGHS